MCSLPAHRTFGPDQVLWVPPADVRPTSESHTSLGGNLSLFEDRDGWRYTAFATGTQVGVLQWLEARHHAHARIEDRIRTGHRPGPAAVAAVRQQRRVVRRRGGRRSTSAAGCNRLGAATGARMIEASAVSARSTNATWPSQRPGRAIQT
jgi:hypothetical protein